MNNSHTKPGASVLASLRALVPLRQVTFTEARRIAEIQAARLLSLLEVTEYPVLNEVISELPRILIEHVPDLPAFGLSFWNGQNWIIQLSTDQPAARRRFTLFHEYKHIIDHHSAHLLYTGDRRYSAAQQAELAADYFAGCALIPRRALKSAWGNGIQHPAALAEYFATSVQAIGVRLDQTGLREPSPRCAAPPQPSTTRSNREPYYRAFTTHQSAGASS